jgi:hypothetical protein
MIIGLTGKAGSGKDTIGKYIESEYGFKRVAFADKLKELAYASNPLVTFRNSFIYKNKFDNLKNYIVMSASFTEYSGTEPEEYNLIYLKYLVDEIGWDKAKEIESVREYLQNMGVGGREIFGEDFWVNELFNTLDLMQNYVITDVRFDNEAKRILNCSFRNMILYVDRDIPKINNHISEHGISKSLITLTVNNNGTTDDLHTTIKSLFKHYRK